jgi:hypothetical protein
MKIPSRFYYRLCYTNGDKKAGQCSCTPGFGSRGWTRGDLDISTKGPLAQLRVVLCFISGLRSGLYWKKRLDGIFLGIPGGK